MSFNFEFVAKQSDVVQIVEKEHAPACVKEFVGAAVAAFVPDALVSVKANGHLWNKDYSVSTAQITVAELKVRAAP